MKKSISSLLAAVIILGACASSFPQSAPQSTKQTRQDQLQAAQVAADQDLGIRRKEMVDKAQQQAAPAKINITPNTAINGVVDPDAIAKKYSKIKSAAPEKRDEDMNELMVFVSLSMPKASLENVARDSRKAGASMIMRGVSKGVGPGRWVQSMAALEPLTQNGGEVSLHPDLFERYGIKRVPAIVVAAEPNAGCTEDACREFAVIYGDVSLAYALERLTDRTDLIGSIARQRLVKLEKR